MKKFQKIAFGLYAFSAICGSSGQAVEWTVDSSNGGYVQSSSNSGSLVYCLWNAQPGDKINFSGTVSSVTLTQHLPAIVQTNLVIEGNSVSIDGVNQYMGFSVAASNVTIQNVNMQNLVSSGGGGGKSAGKYAGGGGGATGGGGGVYLAPNAQLTIDSLAFNSCKAIGGRGGDVPDTNESQLAVGGGGGGGFGGGNGHDATPIDNFVTPYVAGGGGGHAGGGSSSNAAPHTRGGGAGGSGGGNLVANGYDANCDSPSSCARLGGSGAQAQTGIYTYYRGGGGAGISEDGQNATADRSGGGGSGIAEFGGFGGGGGGGGGFPGGSGAGAGGAGSQGNGGRLGGGGGGGSLRFGFSPGVGGFGAGDGGAVTFVQCASNYLGSGGDGGSAFGGTIYISENATLNVKNNLSISNSSVVAGSGGSGYSVSSSCSTPSGVSGLSLGKDVFLCNNATLLIDIGSSSITFNNSIDSYNGSMWLGKGGGPGSLIIESGNVTLKAVNTYGGSTKVVSGNLYLTGSASIASSTLDVGDGLFDISQVTTGTSISTLSGNSSAGNVNLGLKHLTISTAKDATFKGAFSAGNTGSLTYQSNYTLTLTGNSSIPGGVVINSGTINLSEGGGFSSSTPITLGDGGVLKITSPNSEIGSLYSPSASSTLDVVSGTLTINQSSPKTFAGVFAGQGQIILTGSSVLSLTGVSANHQGSISIENATLSIAAGGGLNPSVSINVGDLGIFKINMSPSQTASIGSILSGAVGGVINFSSGTLLVNQTATTTFLGSLTGSGGSLSLAGGGSLTLSQPSTYLGETNIIDCTLGLASGATLDSSSIVNVGSKGVLQISGDTSIGTLAGDVGAEVVLGSGTLTINQSTDQSFAGVLRGSSGFVLQGGGTLSLTQASSLTGTANIANGTISFSDSGSLSTQTSLSVGSAGRVIVNNTLQIGTLLPGDTGGVISINSGSLSVNQTGSTTFLGSLTGSGGSLSLNGGGALTLSQPSTYAGQTNIIDCTLSLLSGATLDSSSIVNVGSKGVLQISGDTSIGTLKGDVGAQVNLGSGTLTINQIGSTTFLGSFTGSAGPLSLNGGGALTFSQPSTYAGQINIIDCTLGLASGASLNTASVVNVGSNGVLQISGDTSIGTLKGDVGAQVNLGSGTLTINQSTDQTFAGVLQGSSGFVLQGGKTLSLTQASSLTGTANIANGTALFSGLGSLSSQTPLSLGSSGRVVVSSVLQIGTLLPGDTGGIISINSGSLTVNQTSTTTFLGSLTGSGGSLSLTGGGSLTLSQPSTYTGQINISRGALDLVAGATLDSFSIVNVGSSGVLQISGDTSIGTLAGDVGAKVNLGSGTLTINQSTNQTFAGVLQGSGGFVLQGGATLSLTQASSLTGTANIANGTVSFSGLGSFSTQTPLSVGSSGRVVVSSDLKIGTLLPGDAGGIISIDSGSLSINQTGSTTFFGSLTGSGGSISLNGGGSLTLSQASTYTGQININRGALGLVTGATLDSSSIVNVGSSGVLQVLGDTSIGTFKGDVGAQANLGSGTLTINQSTDQTFAGVLQGSGGFVLQGGKTLSLTQASSLTGTANIANGTISFSDSGSFSTQTSLSVGSAGRVVVSSALKIGTLLPGDIAGVITINSGSLSINQTGSTTFLGSLTGSGGSLSLTGGGSLNLSQPSTYTGRVNVIDGILGLAAGATLDPVSVVNLESSGVLQILGDTSVGSLRGAIGAQVDLGSRTLTINQLTNQTFAGVLKGSGGFVLQGGKTLSLTQPSSLTGTANIANGTVAFSGSGSLSSQTSLSVGSAGRVVVNNTLQIGTLLPGDTGGVISINSGGLAINQTGSTTFLGSLTGSRGSLSLTGGGSLTLSQPSTYAGQTNIIDCTLSLVSGASLNTDSIVNVGSAGILKILGNTSIGSLKGSVGSQVDLDAGLLTINQSTNGTYSGVFTGAGDLVVGGAASLTLNANSSSYTGTVTVNNGNVILTGNGNFNNLVSLSLKDKGRLEVNVPSLVSVGGFSGSSGTKLALNSGVLDLFLTSDNVFQGQISGGGGLRLSSVGALSITYPQDSFSGNLEILDGTLNLYAQGSLPSLSSLVVNGSFNISGLSALSAVIPNLSGSNPSASVLLGNKAIVMQVNSDCRYVGTIEGIGGGVTKDGEGSLFLSNRLTYTGQTQVLSGALFLENLASLENSSSVRMGSATLDISGLSAQEEVFHNFSGESDSFLQIGSKNLVLNNNARLSFFGDINGATGAIYKKGSADLTLVGTGTYQGGTFLQEGSLTLLNQNAIGSGLLVTSDATAVTLGSGVDLQNNIVFQGGTTFINVDDTAVLSGNSSGLGGFNKAGLGKLIINGNFSSAGVNKIAAGEVKVVGSILSGVQVDSDAVLSGCGLLGPVELKGTFKPGCSSSKIVVDGGFDIQAGSQVSIRVDSNSQAFIINNGKTSIDSSALAFFDIQDGYRKLTNTFAFIKASQLNGHFGSALTSSPLYNAFVFNKGTDVYAVIKFVDFSNSIVISDKNARHIGRALIALLKQKDSDIYPIIDDLIHLPSLQDLEPSLEQMNLSYYKGLAVQQEFNSVLVSDSITYRIEQLINSMYCYSAKSYKKADDVCGLENGLINLWVDGFGDFISQDNNKYADSPQTGYKNSTGGVSVGVDGCFAEYFTGGVVGAYSNSSLNWKQSRAYGDINTGYVGLYLSGITQYFYATTSVVGSWSNYYTKRQIKYPGVFEQASSSRGGAQINSQLNLGCNFNFYGIQFRPFNTFQYICQTENKFSESGAGAYNLSVRKNNSILIRNEVGFQLGGCYCFSGSTWSLTPQISWVREVRVKGANYKARFVNTDETFVLTGYFPDRSLISPGVFLSKMFWDNRISLDAYYKGEFGSGYLNNSFGGQIRVGF